ncbi:MAG: lipoate--protein ligase [Clostridia bacterium]|nr:lipoate--protein ligase [Clostridia bacterium]
MIIYRNTSTDPYFNMAAEQYLLDTAASPCAMLWRNSRAVVIGKNQNAEEQIDLAFCKAHGIVPVRRLTGGGAVFHDLGNVNFTFIAIGDAKKLDFAAFSKPITDALAKLGVKCRLSGRNDIVVDTEDGERKISGEAQCVYEAGGTKKVLHHGTLLFSADMSLLSGALLTDPEKMVSKGVKSVASRVVNIKDLIDTDLDVSGFLAFLEQSLAEEWGADPVGFSEADAAAVRKLADEKYATDGWLFGRYTRSASVKRKRFPFGTVEAALETSGGVIADIRFTGDFFGVKDVSLLSRSLIGTRLDEAGLAQALSCVGDYIHGARPGDITDLLLS